jgi:uncharacterized membrane protein AbrB (regulator of aidB expression)
MAVMAFVLNPGPAYAGALQMVRYISLALLMPMVTGYVSGRMGVAANVAAPARPAKRKDR